MAIIRIYTGSDGKSHFEEIHPRFESRGDRSEGAELIPAAESPSAGSRRRDPTLGIMRPVEPQCSRCRAQ